VVSQSTEGLLFQLASHPCAGLTDVGMGRSRRATPHCHPREQEARSKPAGRTGTTLLPMRDVPQSVGETKLYERLLFTAAAELIEIMRRFRPRDALNHSSSCPENARYWVKQTVGVQVRPPGYERRARCAAGSD
jgi:hypothetical protein